ncbi:hypothetical protein RRG08_046166 [Elysia crispata]|uniref:Uncharacterized protein n=1 Tax=Elysia crispata TaxID=231223 RepID=A0AAE1CJ47_9GAST|nr:hypothetical protein RRG08_046166 [Elysia crispata]
MNPLTVADMSGGFELKLDCYAGCGEKRRSCKYCNFNVQYILSLTSYERLPHQTKAQKTNCPVLMPKNKQGMNRRVLTSSKSQKNNGQGRVENRVGNRKGRKYLFITESRL